VSLKRFLLSLMENGRVKLAEETPVDGQQLIEAEPLLRQIDQLARLNLPDQAPPLSMVAARWAARTLYRACQFLVWRHLPAERVQADLAEPCPEPASPAICYSVDLTMRYLPDAHRLARGLAEDDPLVAALEKLAADWPLSSVGVPLLQARVSPFVGHRCLRRLYAERIILRADRSRLDQPIVLQEVRATLGLYAHRLAPGLLPDTPATPAQHPPH
jgi:hypothetical protein